MIDREWVILHILWKTVLAWHLFLWLTVCEWHCTFWKGSLIPSFPMTTNREWATLHILLRAWVLSQRWPIAGEQYCIFCETVSSYNWQKVSDLAHFVRQSHHIFSYDQQIVSDIAHLAKASLKIFSITNSLWVTLHIFGKAASSHLFIWPTVCEWNFPFCER